MPRPRRSRPRSEILPTLYEQAEKLRDQALEIQDRTAETVRRLESRFQQLGYRGHCHAKFVRASRRFAACVESMRARLGEV